MGPNKLSPKFLARFYEVLVLLRVLDQVQGDKIAKPILSADRLDQLETIEIRRKILYHLCIICDYQKGGFTVTALAAENVPSGPRYWLAANGHIEKIRAFLFPVLQLLENQSLLDSQDVETLATKDAFLERIVHFQRPRLREYWKLLNYHIEDELRRLNLTPRSHGGDEYGKWLRAFQDPHEEACDFLKVCELSYAERHSPFLRAEYDPAAQQRVVEESQSRSSIRHYIGRFSTLKRATQFLIDAARECPAMFQQFSLQHVPSKTTSPHPPARNKLTLEGIANRMFSEKSTRSRAFEDLLQGFNETGSIMDRVLEQYSNENWKPNVHAELALLEATYEKQCSFYDEDRFIACSKAACFCCYHYICNHPGNYTRPACHNKLYLNWKPPELCPVVSGVQAFSQQDVMNQVIVAVRKAVVERVFRQQRRKWHPDSSTGITPSLVADLKPLSNPSDEQGPLIFAVGSEGSQTPAGTTAHGMTNHVSGMKEDDDEDGGVPLP